MQEQELVPFRPAGLPDLTSVHRWLAHGHVRSAILFGSTLYGPQLLSAFTPADVDIVIGLPNTGYVRGNQLAGDSVRPVQTALAAQNGVSLLHADGNARIKYRLSDGLQVDAVFEPTPVDARTIARRGLVSLTCMAMDLFTGQAWVHRDSLADRTARTLTLRADPAGALPAYLPKLQQRFPDHAVREYSA